MVRAFVSDMPRFGRTHHGNDGEPVIEVECACDPFPSKHSAKHEYCAKDGYSKNYTQNSWAFVGREVSIRVGVF
jgi:hypothetical protein